MLTLDQATRLARPLRTLANKTQEREDSVVEALLHAESEHHAVKAVVAVKVGRTWFPTGEDVTAALRAAKERQSGVDVLPLVAFKSCQLCVGGGWRWGMVKSKDKQRPDAHGVTRCSCPLDERAPDCQACGNSGYFGSGYCDCLIGRAQERFEWNSNWRQRA